MHEASVAQSILDIVIEETKKADATKVLCIEIVIGELSCISADAVETYFSVIRDGTPAEGAKLVFKLDKALFKCKNCEKEYNKNGIDFSCPSCKGEGTLVKKSARDFYIDKMEVE